MERQACGEGFRSAESFFDRKFVRPKNFLDERISTSLSPKAKAKGKTKAKPKAKAGGLSSWQRPDVRAFFAKHALPPASAAAGAAETVAGTTEEDRAMSAVDPAWVSRRLDPDFPAPVDASSGDSAGIVMVCP